MEYRHKKTGSLYVMLSQAIDCTNSRDGTPVVVYAPKGDMARVYVRDESEFNEKFEPVASVRGSHIKRTMRHDAGAYARCSYCGRYSDKIEALNKDEWPCECGKLHGWSGSFIPPTAESQWSEVTPNVELTGEDQDN